MARAKAPRPMPPRPATRRLLGYCGLSCAAAAYVGIDYLRYLSPTWHERLQPVLWAALALAAAGRAPFYRHWDAELRAALPFLGAIVFMLSAFLCEMISVRFVSAVMGLQWHGSAAPLPDTGQWLLLALNEKLPGSVVDLLRAHVITLHHYLMLFMMLGFSVLFDCIKAPGLGIATRYMVTMAIGRLLRTATFITTILPSARPWCAAGRYQIPGHPHPWAQKYYVPYASDSHAIRGVIDNDMAYADVQSYPGEHRPDWGRLSFLVDILRPTPGEGPQWYHLLKKASGGCNDLMYSGHMLVSVLTAMAWTEAYGGWISVAIWLLVLHSAQREIRERHHYTVDCVVAIYVGILLWRMTRFIWSARDASRARRLAKLEEVQGRLIHAAKDSDIDEIRDLLKQVELAGHEKKGFSQRAILAFAAATIMFTLTCVVLALTLTSDG
ncbi:protein PHLOEM UNLOADING MODULATOR [Lolium perenne]|uniref:protein PHLOEM UNLOADING MODULATOR n=1 Tax=Lolium perenne TaxID=4522 RepID=UPI0021EA95F3|nr:protein PHLOEM UNLOADING MODULATOR [Lolium perenne]